MNYYLVGNPNVGKTCLYNNITRQNERISNYSGVTVDSKTKTINYGKEKLSVTDLPGVYDLNSESPDEKIAIEKIKTLNPKEDVVVFVCSSDGIFRNINLYESIRKIYSNVLVIVNLFSKRLSKVLNTELSQVFGKNFMVVDVRKKRKDILKFLVDSVANFKYDFNENFSINFEILNKLKDKIESLNIKHFDFDKLLLKKWFGIPFCFLCLFFCFWLAFGKLGEYLYNLTFSLFEDFGAQLFLTKLPIWASKFICDCIINAVGSVVAFVPQLAIILGGLWILEETGIFARLTFLLNTPLSKIGLSGHSVYSLFMGFGCTTSAVIGSRNISSPGIRENTIKFLPFVGCSAKFPILLYVASLININNSFLFVIFMYLLFVSTGFISASVFNKNKKNDFVTELPKFNFPNLKTFRHEVGFVIKDFIKKVSVSVFFVSVILYVLNSIVVAENVSLLVFICENIALLFKPLGLNNWQIVSALITGLVAKENLLSAITLFDAFSGISIISGLTFIIFVWFYSPCVPALCMIAKETKLKTSLYVFAFHTVLSYLLSFIFYTFANYIGIVGGLLFLYLGFYLLCQIIKLYFVNKSLTLKRSCC